MSGFRSVQSAPVLLYGAGVAPSIFLRESLIDFSWLVNLVTSFWSYWFSFLAVLATSLDSFSGSADFSMLISAEAFFGCIVEALIGLKLLELKCNFVFVILSHIVRPIVDKDRNQYFLGGIREAGRCCVG